MGIPLAHLKALTDRVSISQWLVYGYTTDDGIVLTRDNGMGFILEIAPIAGAGEDTEKVLRGIFESQLPDRTTIQIMLYASDKIEQDLREYVATRNPLNPATESARQRADFMRKAASTSLLSSTILRPRKFRLFLSVKIPAPRTPQEVKARIPAVRRIRSGMMQTCRSIPTAATALDNKGIVGLLRELINPGHDFTDEPLHSPKHHPLNREVVMDSSLCQILEDSLKIDNRIIRVMTPKQYPDYWRLSMMSMLIGDLYQATQQIMTPFLLTLNVIISPQEEIRQQTQFKAGLINNQAQGPLAKLIPRLLIRKEAFDTMLMALEQGLYGLQACLHLVLMAQTDQEIVNASRAAQAIWRTRNFILQEDAFIAFQLWLESLPLGLHADKRTIWEFGRAKTMHSGNAATLAPIVADWSGTQTPTLLFVSRRGQLMKIDLFDNQMGNFNTLVAAASGSGKSFLVNEIINAYNAQDATVWVIDVGRSYLKLCSLLKGQFIEFSPSAKISLNPFTRITDFNEHLDLLKAIIVQMALPNTPVTDLQKSIIEQALMGAWEKEGNDLTITRLAEYLAFMRDEVATELAQLLYPYTSRGTYSRWFDPPANIAFDHLTVLELEELKAKPDLQKVILQLNVFQIQQHMFLASREQKKIVIFDEAWDLLRGGNTADFIEAGYRRFRKYRGAAITITQGINDLYGIGRAGQAIIDNSDWLFLLRQKPESLQALKESKRLPVNEALMEYLMSVHTIKNEYGEVFISSPMGMGIGKLIVDRFSQLVFTSDAAEYSRIIKFVDQGMSIPEAINKIIAAENQQKIKL